jgi:hypothetical protein
LFFAFKYIFWERVRRFHQISKQVRGTENVKNPWCKQNYVLVGAKFSAPVQAGPGNHPASFTMGTDRFPGGEVAGTWRWTPTHISAEVKEIVELYLKLLSVTSWPVLGWTFPFTFYTNSSRKNEVRCRRRRGDITELILNQQDLVLWVPLGIIEQANGSSCCIKSGNCRKAEWQPAIEEGLWFLCVVARLLWLRTASSPACPFIVCIFKHVVIV